MKTAFVLVVCAGLLLAGNARAQAFSPPPEWVSVKLIQTVDPVFPHQLTDAGVTEGWAHIVIDTDAKGTLVEWLVAGYSRKEFADAAVVAIKQWTVEPAKMRSEPVGTIVDVLFNFEAKGVVISTSDPGVAFDRWMSSIIGDRFTYRTYTLKDLDRIPTPLVTVKPQYPPDVANRRSGKVSVDFYIDETGAVRMPAVSASDDSELSALAVDALKRWKFEPPLRGGRTVMVKAAQVFSFDPNK